ncbi:MAG: undecaprenyl-diphosphate phosphatase [Deltaproteobacteria bacterium]|nr:undecaprenyl-diphosphate phosphatase [Deltaproteobacteria bacterium]
MNILDAAILGFIQGLTEFLPISSSGHLVIFQNLLGFAEPQLLLDVTLHVGTLLAVVVYFKEDIFKITRQVLAIVISRIDSSHGTKPDNQDKLILWIIIASIPTALIGFFFKGPLERLFTSVSVVGVMLLVTGIIIGITYFIPSRYTSRMNIDLITALLIGTAQGLAIIPGISRSGATIACGLLCGLDRELAGRFSFLVAIPAIIGALLLQLHQQSLTSAPLTSLTVGFMVSATVGFLCLKILMTMVKKGHLAYFAPYCFIAGAMALVLF